MSLSESSLNTSYLRHVGTLVLARVARTVYCEAHMK